jgi:hypothetical protein
MSSQMTKTMLQKYESNLTAGQHILQTFTDTSSRLQVIRYAILVAQMQSGKTFTYMFLFMEMFRIKRIDTVVIFSGNAELALKKQTQECLDNRDFEEFYKQHLVQNCNVPEDLVEDVWESRKQKVSKNFQVVWGTEGAKHCTPKKRTLFIWDESHFAQDKKMCPDKFLETMGILPNGDFRRLNDSDNYVLSVSATPFSEICDIQHQQQGKMVVPFVPSESYWGVQRMWESGMIVEYNDTKEEARKQMTDMERFEGQKKIGIIRIPKSSKKGTTESYERVFTQMATQLDYDVFLYYEAENEEQKEDRRRITNRQFLEMLDEDNLTRNSLILIKEHCRMGQVLKKKNISFVMESSNNSRTDVVLQGLLGRMCGYDGNPLIRVCLKATNFFEKDVIRKDALTGVNYIDSTNELEKYIEFTQQLQRLPVGSLPWVMPIHCRNLIADEKTNIYEKQETTSIASMKAGGGPGNGPEEQYEKISQDIIPIKFPRGVDSLDERCVKFMTGTENTERTRTILDKTQISLIPEMYREGINYNQPDIKNALDELLEENMTIYQKNPERPYGTLFAKHTINEDAAKRIRESLRTRKACSLGSSNRLKKGGRQIGIYIAPNDKDFTEYGIEAGDVFLWTFVQVRLDKKNVEEVNLPKTTEKELFCRTTECGETLESNGACGMELAKETANDVDVMKTAIISRIGTKMDGWIDSRKITSNNAGGTRWSGIYVSNEVFNALQKRGEIYEEVLRRFKVKLVLKQPRGRKPCDETMIRLCEISW